MSPGTLDDGCLHDALDDSFLTSLRQGGEVDPSDYDQRSSQDIAVLVDFILWERWQDKGC